MTKSTKIYTGEKKLFLINGAGKIRFPYAEEWNWTPFLHICKNHSRSIKDLNVGPENIKILKENQGKSLLDIGLGKEFLRPQKNKQQNQK